MCPNTHESLFVLFARTVFKANCLKDTRLSAVVNGSCFPPRALASIQGHGNPAVAGLISSVDKAADLSQ